MAFAERKLFGVQIKRAERKMFMPMLRDSLFAVADDRPVTLHEIALPRTRSRSANLTL